MAAFREILKSAQNIIVVAGAGLSAASGIPTFRGAGGLWRTHEATELATPEAFAEDPSRVWQFYHYRREKARAALPNAAHYALATFSLPSIRAQLAPDASFTLITQNVDGLSPRALTSLAESQPALAEEATSAAVRESTFEMHGRIFEVVCTAADCRHAEFNTDSPICAALAGTEAVFDGSAPEPTIEEKDLPRCGKCGALARPGVVWFGEIPRYMEEIEKKVRVADVCLVVGTSSSVQPAAGFAAKVQRWDGKVAVFNIERSAGDERADFLFLGPCEETLPKALGLAAE